MGEEGYDLVTKNCQHFATECRYDVSKSHGVFRNYFISLQYFIFKFFIFFIKVTTSINVSTGIAIAGAGVALLAFLWPKKNTKKEKEIYL